MTPLSQTSRPDARASFTFEHRVILLEQDADKADAAHTSLVAEIRALRGVLTGILVSLATASVLLAINLVAGLG